LSLTTSAKCVNLSLTPSIIAIQANALTLVLAFLVITFSTLPLAASFYLLLLLYKQARSAPVLIESLQDNVSFASATQYESDSGRYRVDKVLFTLLPIGLVIIHQDKQKVMLWRDSVSEEKYRELVVMLKREH
jgi:hypothetical protein